MDISIVMKLKLQEHENAFVRIRRLVDEKKNRNKIRIKDYIKNTLGSS